MKMKLGMYSIEIERPSVGELFEAAAGYGFTCMPVSYTHLISMIFRFRLESSMYSFNLFQCNFLLRAFIPTSSPYFIPLVKLYKSVVKKTRNLIEKTVFLKGWTVFFIKSKM